MIFATEQQETNKLSICGNLFEWWKTIRCHQCFRCWKVKIVFPIWRINTVNLVSSAYFIYITWQEILAIFLTYTGTFSKSSSTWGVTCTVKEKYNLHWIKHIFVYILTENIKKIKLIKRQILIISEDINK